MANSKHQMDKGRVFNAYGLMKQPCELEIDKP